MAAVVLAGATAAVPLMVPGVTGAPVAAPVLLTANYDQPPQPGVLLDLMAVLDWQSTGADVAAAEWAGPVGWVWPLPASPGLLVVPARSGVQGFRTDVVAVVVEPDGTERWRVTKEDFTDSTYQECASSAKVVNCWGVHRDGTVAVLQIDVENGAVLAQQTLSDSVVRGSSTRAPTCSFSVRAPPSPAITSPPVRSCGQRT